MLIYYYDEVLTQSARNYAFTQDKKWEKRYRESEPKLIATLEEALADGDHTDKEFLESIKKANLKIVEMEYRSIEHVNSGQTQQADRMISPASTTGWTERRGEQPEPQYVPQRTQRNLSQPRTVRAIPRRGLSHDCPNQTNDGP